MNGIEPATSGPRQAQTAPAPKVQRVVLAIGGDLAKLSGHAIATNAGTLVTASLSTRSPRPRRRWWHRSGRQMVDLRTVTPVLTLFVDGVPFADITGHLEIRPGGEWMALTRT